VARLARARVPYELAGRRVERRAFGQAFGGEGQHVVGIRISSGDEETPFLADQKRVIAFVDDRCAVNVGHPDDHLDLVTRARWINRAQLEDMIAGLVEPWGPLDLAAAGHEQSALWQSADHRILHRLAVRITGENAEHQVRALA